MTTRASKAACLLLGLVTSTRASPLAPPNDVESLIPQLLSRQTSSGRANSNTNTVSYEGVPGSYTKAQNASASTKSDSVINNTTGLTPGLIGSQSNPNSDAVNCSDPLTGRSDDCWAQLGLSKYVSDWVETHECYPREGLARCFYRLNGLGTIDCDSISASSCVPPELPGTSDPQLYYVAYNIYALNAFFKTWYIAVGDGSESAEDNIGDIASLISLNNANIIQSKLSSDLGKLTKQIRQNLNVTTVRVLQNHTEFIAFASQGNFSSGVVSLPDATDYMTYAFNTYLSSNALSTSNVFSTLGKNTNVKDLATNGTSLAYPLNCTAYDSNSLCDTFYYSENYKSTFGLVSRDTPEQNYARVLDSLFSNYTTGALLFEDSYACNSISGNPANVTVTTAGVNTACIGSLQTFTWDMNCHANPTASGDENNGCEFLEKGKESGFWAAGNNDTRSVPAAYLGPAIAQNKFKISRGDQGL